jgi:endonuclease/exonuclease/phosphatase (EEP) superfamily protein YafD
MLVGMIVVELLAALYVAFALLRLSGVDGNRYTACALALTPFAVAGGGVLGIVAVALAQWWTGGIVVGVTVGLAGMHLPLVIRSPRPHVDGRRLRVLASNLYLGRGDVKTLVELVREHDVDLLGLLELTPEATEDLARAGLFDLLPHRLLCPAAGGTGSGLVSRYPLAELTLADSSWMAQPSARFNVGNTTVEAVAVHTTPPTMSPKDWKTQMNSLPRPADGAIRILAGDFNATFDHATFRRLLRTGYLDAARSRGKGLMATWPAGAVLPVALLDHILVDGRAAVTAYRPINLPGSDHKAVYAELILPRI